MAGGTSAAPGQFPHQVSLRNVSRGNTHFCSGSVIDHFFLLTAASCFTYGFTPGAIQIVAGVHELNATGGTEQVCSVGRAIIHENYNTTTWDNDIALLILNEPLRFDDYTKPIRLRSREKGKTCPYSIELAMEIL